MKRPPKLCRHKKRDYAYITLSGKQVYLVTKTDSSVLAGLRVEMEGKRFDGTAAGRIAGISRRLEELVV